MSPSTAVRAIQIGRRDGLTPKRSGAARTISVVAMKLRQLVCLRLTTTTGSTAVLASQIGTTDGAVANRHGAASTKSVDVLVRQLTIVGTAFRNGRTFGRMTRRTTAVRI